MESVVFKGTNDSFKFQIRLANANDMPNLLNLYHQARLYMIDQGNPTQWQNYPSQKILANDIAQKQLYLLESADNKLLLAAFVCQLKIEEDYELAKIHWHSNSLHYATLHRVASARIMPHTFNAIMQFALAKTKQLYSYSYLRIDTHDDNLPMQAAIKKAGFQFCGKIKLRLGGERLAYDYLALGQNNLALEQDSFHQN